MPGLIPEDRVPCRGRGGHQTSPTNVCPGSCYRSEDASWAGALGNPSKVFEKRDDLKKLLIVVEEGRIHSAAHKLNVTQPALSRVISKLERQFKGQIFERMPKGVRLTQFGTVVLEQVRHILREIERAEQEVNLTVEGGRGSLRVSASPIWMHALLPRVIKLFHEDFPMVEVVLNTTSYSQGVRMLREGKSDLHCGIFNRAESLPRFLAREPLSKLSFKVVAHEHHPIHSIEQPSYADLIKYPWIDFELDTQTDQNNQPPSVGWLLQRLEKRTGRLVKKVLRTSSAGLHLMESGPYLAYLCPKLAGIVPGIPLKPVAIKAFRSRTDAVTLSLRYAKGDAPMRHFKAILKSSALEVDQSGDMD